MPSAALRRWITNPDRQFKLADKLDSRLVAIIGPDELAQGLIKIRNMDSHEERSVPINEALAAIDGEL